MAGRATDPPLADSLEAAARELDAIARQGLELQARLGPLLRRGGEAAFEAQALDALVQQAQGLAAFLGALGADCPMTWRASAAKAAAGLGLAAQKRRLNGAVEPAHAPAPAGGELELF